MAGLEQNKTNHLLKRLSHSMRVEPIILLLNQFFYQLSQFSLTHFFYKT